MNSKQIQTKNLKTIHMHYDHLGEMYFIISFDNGVKSDLKFIHIQSV